MLDDLIRRRAGQKAQVLAASPLMVGGEPILLARSDRPQVDLLTAESHRSPQRLPRRWRGVLARHAEHPLIPAGRDLKVADLDDQMVQRLHFQGHKALFCSQTPTARVTAASAGN